MKKFIYGLFIAVIVLALMALPVAAASGNQSEAGPVIDLLPETLIMLAGGAVSLFFSYFPVLRVKFAALEPEHKSLVMIGVLFCLTAAMVALSCAGVLQINGFVCSKDGFIRAAWMFMLALIANQGTYQITPVATDVKLTKALRG